MAVLLAALLACGQDDLRIEDLASEDPDARDAAAGRLLRAGRDAWPALRKARDGPDPQVARAADRILRTSHRRRGLPHSLLREFPDALALLDGPSCPAKIRLLRAMGCLFEECLPFLQEALRDPDVDSRVTAAEILFHHRDDSWVEPLLRLLAGDPCPRAARIGELLYSASARVPPRRFEELFFAAGPAGRARLAALAASAGLAVDLPRPLLHDLLRGDSPRPALAWIRLHPDPQDLREVDALLDSADALVVADALGTLRVLGGGDPGRLAPLLDHESAAVRAGALEALDAADAPGLARAAELRLDDVSSAVRRLALLLLWKRRGPGALETMLDVYFSQDGDPRELAGGCLTRCRGWARPRILEAAASRDPDRRLRALELLHTMDGPGALTAALRDPDETIRRWALGRLVAQDSPQSLPALESLTSDPDVSVRFEALRALVRRGRAEHAEELAMFLDSREYAFVLAAAETLLDHGGPAIPALARRVLRQDDPLLRKMALESLAERRRYEAVAEAIECLAMPDPRLQRTAIQYLTQAYAAHRIAGIIPSVRERLSGILGEAAEPALLLVAAAGGEESRRALSEALRGGRLSGPERALRSLLEAGGTESDLARLLGDSAALNERVLRLAAGRNLFGAEIASRVRELARDPDPEVRAGAFRAAFGSGCLDLLRAALEDSDAEVRCIAIAACRDRGLLRRALEDDAPEVRIASAAALVRMGETAAVARAAREEEHAWVRRRMIGEK